MASKFIKSKTNYTYKDDHQKTDGGHIFEKDLATIDPSKRVSNGKNLYSESTFLFVTRPGNRLQKKHKQGNWLVNEDGETQWTLENITSNISINGDDDYKINKDYQSLRDFAYYGSAKEYLKASIINIISKFPAELHFNKELVSLKIETVNTGETITAFTIDNDFIIDVSSQEVKEKDIENPLRYFYLSSDKYECISGDVVYDTIILSSVTPSIHTMKDAQNFDILNTCNFVILNEFETIVDNFNIYEYKYSDEKRLAYTGTNRDDIRFRPKEDYIEEAFKTFNAFENALVNRNTNPLYTVSFDTPYENDKGYYIKKERYTWPNKFKWNLDLNSIGYEKYVNRLVALAEFHDTYDTDNIWRSMTHEAIKNLDWTFINKDDEEIQNIDTSRIVPILKIYGRCYDELKGYIDNIKYLNNVSYDKKNNVPDDFIADNLKLSGWEVKSLIPSYSSSEEVEIDYSGNTKYKYNYNDTNIEFLRRLKLNSKYLLSIKGTLIGLKSILGLMGFKERKNGIGDYEINEKVLVASAETPYLYTAITKCNRYLNRELEAPTLEGLPLIKINRFENDEDKSYVMPWFDKNLSYDGNLYFQMKGGWNKLNEKWVNNPINETSGETKIYSEESGINIYNETSNYIKYVNEISEMFNLGVEIDKGEICFVSDLSNIGSYYSGITVGDSHYFALYDEEYRKFPEGWAYINDTYFSNHGIDESILDTYGAFCLKMSKKIKYLNSLIERVEGNNPHVGFGTYDDGRQYMEDMLKPFNEALNDLKLSKCLSNNERIECSGKTWTGNIINDNKKCWFFGKDSGITTNESFYNPENPNKKYEEPAANSVINVKNIEIKFYIKDATDKLMEKFIQNNILYYLEQMLPSSCIADIKIENEESSSLASILDVTRNLDDNVDGLIYGANDLTDGLDMLDSVEIINN